MTKFLATLFVAIALLIASPRASTAAAVMVFHTAQQAQHHCPHDVVVWLNLRSGIYHLKGERWYGRTRHGAYACKKEADKAGDRETRNGQ